MSEKRTLMERLSNRFFAIPAVAQLWGKRTARHTAGIVDLADGIPFATFNKSLSQCKVALLTTGGVHLPEQEPFDMTNPDGDASYRTIPVETPTEEITITHKYYDHSDADVDLNVVFPLDHFRALVNEGVIGALASEHFGFMGHIDGKQVSILNSHTAPEVAAKLRAEGVDFAFLTPA